MNETRLAAFKIERRSVSAAVFAGEQLDYTHLRQLASDPRKAESSAVGFAQWIVDALRVEGVAVEQVDSKVTSRRQSLTEAVVSSLRADGVVVWQVLKTELLFSYGVPALKTRTELRAVVDSFWPVVPTTAVHGSALDAAALGLYVQIQRALA
jgi:hypothetical protein